CRSVKKKDYNCQGKYQQIFFFDHLKVYLSMIQFIQITNFIFNILNSFFTLVEKKWLRNVSFLTGVVSK
ncbi:MAG: hypothetical protein ABIY50_10905, partial [Ignavibacteria bacterium]